MHFLHLGNIVHELDEANPVISVVQNMHECGCVLIKIWGGIDLCMFHRAGGIRMRVIMEVEWK